MDQIGHKGVVSASRPRGHAYSTEVYSAIHKEYHMIKACIAVHCWAEGGGQGIKAVCLVQCFGVEGGVLVLSTTTATVTAGHSVRPLSCSITLPENKGTCQCRGRAAIFRSGHGDRIIGELTALCRLMQGGLKTVDSSDLNVDCGKLAAEVILSAAQSIGLDLLQYCFSAM